MTYSADYQSYGYLWWLDTKNDLAFAEGSGGQYISVDRAEDLTVVALNDTGQCPLGTFWYQQFGDDVPRSVMGELREAVLDAQRQNP